MPRLTTILIALAASTSSKCEGADWTNSSECARGSCDLPPVALLQRTVVDRRQAPLYVKLSTGHCPIERQVSKADCLTAAKTFGASDAKTQLDFESDSGDSDRPPGCTIHNFGDVEWWEEGKAECGNLEYACVCKAQVTSPGSPSPPTPPPPTPSQPSSSPSPPPPPTPFSACEENVSPTTPEWQTDADCCARHDRDRARCKEGYIMSKGDKCGRYSHETICRKSGSPACHTYDVESECNRKEVVGCGWSTEANRCVRTCEDFNCWPGMFSERVTNSTGGFNFCNELSGCVQKDCCQTRLWVAGPLFVGMISPIMVATSTR